MCKLETKHPKMIEEDVGGVRKIYASGLIRHEFRKDSLRILVYSDSSFENNCDISTQLGYFILLKDITGSANVLQFLATNRSGLFERFSEGRCMPSPMDSIRHKSCVTTSTRCSAGRYP